MNGRKLVEKGLRRGIPLWQIEERLDWQENQGPHWAKDDVRKQHGPVAHRSTHDTASASKSALPPDTPGPTTTGTAPNS